MKDNFSETMRKESGRNAGSAVFFPLIVISATAEPPETRRFDLRTQIRLIVSFVTEKSIFEKRQISLLNVYVRSVWVGVLSPEQDVF